MPRRVSGVLARQAKQGILLTPHPGEWARLTTAKIPHPHTLALCKEVKQLAVAQGLHLVYKSACPLLFTPQATDPTYVCDDGMTTVCPKQAVAMCCVV